MSGSGLDSAPIAVDTASNVGPSSSPLTQPPVPEGSRVNRSSLTCSGSSAGSGPSWSRASISCFAHSAISFGVQPVEAA
ncbi:MAG: hypothetical protein M3Z25_20700 [Actinomycetota bacterium]|nr:hypothetical protein [Actinomycetota bacterium]